MAEKISIQISESGALIGSTEVDAGGTVKFTNKASAKAHIDFGDKSPFCPQKMDYQLKAGNSKTLYVCPNYGISRTYAYALTVGEGESQGGTLKVTGLVATNPYVFPEKKPIVFPEDWTPLLIGLVLGVVTGVLVGRRLLAPNRRAP